MIKEDRENMVGGCVDPDSVFEPPVVPKKWDWKKVSENYKIEDKFTRSILRDLVARQNDILCCLEHLIGMENPNGQNFRNLYGRVGDLEERHKTDDHVTGNVLQRLEKVESHPALSIPPLESPEKSLLRNCPHCGGDHRDLSVERMIFDEITGEDTSATRQFVYCSCCGHYGDLDTWNDRAPK